MGVANDQNSTKLSSFTRMYQQLYQLELYIDATNVNIVTADDKNRI